MDGNCGLIPAGNKAPHSHLLILSWETRDRTGRIKVGKLVGCDKDSLTVEK